jgi:hypothetical protein
VNRQPLPVQKSNWRFPNQQKVFGMKPGAIFGVEEMSQLSFLLRKHPAKAREFRFAREDDELM